jgi:aspartokinase/homoserine dehydrogenase 1
MSKNWVVHKFGGTSVANADRYKNVIEIIKKCPGNDPQAIVVSAMSKVTDALLLIVDLAKNRDSSYEKKMQELHNRHDACVDELFAQSEHEKLKTNLKDIFKNDFADIKEILRGVWLSKSAPESTQELISGYGEIWSAQILNAAFNAFGTRSSWLDARLVLEVDSMPRKVSVRWNESRKKNAEWFKNNPSEVVIITGFVASRADGVATTLKRNGSDFSGSIFGNLLDAKEIIIWTDVDGVMSADPRLVPDAVVLNDISYTEASELAYFGAKVIHPDTMLPAIEKQIPVWIKNSFKPQVRGTKISADVFKEPPVKGFATIENICLINLEGTGMVGIPGVAQRLFGALKEVDVNVVMISQASSEQSICFAVISLDAEKAQTAVKKTFQSEIQRKEIHNIQVSYNCSVLAMVGDGMAHSPGISGRLFTALGRAQVNILAIAQGSSERNISVVVDQKHIHRAVRAAHSAFFLSNQTLSVGVVGVGVVGSKFLVQLAKRLEKLKTERGIDIRLRGLCNSKTMITEETGLNLKDWNKKLNESEKTKELKSFTQFITESHYPHSVMIDLTASQETTEMYQEWINKGLNIITANKKAGSGDFEYYQKINNSARISNRYFMYETTVGAGLPVLTTLKDMIQTGDELIEMEGVLSGTLSYLFNNYDGKTPFSEVVRQAKENGYTEPDPRDDLSGKDVARKLVILAREAGLNTEMDSVKIENLVPEKLQNVSVDEFLKRLNELDENILSRFQNAQKNNSILRYVGKLKVGEPPTVSLMELPMTHPFARLGGTDNIFLFRTTRYEKQPLVIQGPGAGPDVTAAGVFAELIRLAGYLGAPQ